MAEIRGERGYKPSTVAPHFRTLQQFFRWCVEEDEIERSPFEHLKTSRIPEQPVLVRRSSHKLLCRRGPSRVWMQMYRRSSGGTPVIIAVMRIWGLVPLIASDAIVPESLAGGGRWNATRDMPLVSSG
jgi:hypothetical protein